MRFYLTLNFVNEEGVLLFKTAASMEAEGPNGALPVGLFRDVCHVPAHLLNGGVHRVELLVYRDHVNMEFRRQDVVVFDVLESETPQPWQGHWRGAVRPMLEWTTEAADGRTHSVTRIAFGCFEVPGWGGLTTATYRLFETMLEDGLDVHYVNLILEEELPRFRRLLGADCENPRELPNMHSCILRGALHDAHPEIAAFLDELAPDRVVGVGDISSLLMKKADPERELVFLTAGCMQVNRDIPFTEQLAAMNGSALHPTDWKEEAMGISDLVLTHSPLIRDPYRRFYPDRQQKIHPEVFWFAEWIWEDAAEHSDLALSFENCDIDALFVASNWLRREKNPALLADIASRLNGLSAHIVGEFDDPIASATHHGFVGTRGAVSPDGPGENCCLPLPFRRRPRNSVRGIRDGLQHRRVEKLRQLGAL